MQSVCSGYITNMAFFKCGHKRGEGGGGGG